MSILNKLKEFFGILTKKDIEYRDQLFNDLCELNPDWYFIVGNDIEQFKISTLEHYLEKEKIRKKIRDQEIKKNDKGEIEW